MIRRVIRMIGMRIERKNSRASLAASVDAVERVETV